jgi:hypothetical protein
MTSLCLLWNPSRPKKIAPIPRAEWPLTIKALALLATSKDKGIGDLIARSSSGRLVEMLTRRGFSPNFASHVDATSASLILTLNTL